MYHVQAAIQHHMQTFLEFRTPKRSPFHQHSWWLYTWLRPIHPPAAVFENVCLAFWTLHHWDPENTTAQYESECIITIRPINGMLNSCSNPQISGDKSLWILSISSDDIISAKHCFSSTEEWNFSFWHLVWWFKVIIVLFLAVGISPVTPLQLQLLWNLPINFNARWM